LFAAGPRVPSVAELGVDVVTRKGAPRLLGAVLQRDADGSVTLAVSRGWLQTADPKLFEQAAAAEAVEQRAAWGELRDRIRAWKQARPDEEKLIFFLEQEDERIEKLLAAPDEKAAVDAAPFFVLKLPASKIERVVIQPPQRKQVALVAWRERLAHPETRSVANLTRELRDKGIEIPAVPVDLSAQLPPARQDAAEWAARQAIVEYQYCRRVDFQGIGDLVTRTDEGAPAADLNQLLTTLLTTQLKKDLADLLEPPKAAQPAALPKWWTMATKGAAQAQANGFRVTRLDLNVVGQQVKVETRFVAKLPDGSWQTVWLNVEAADASKPRPDLEQRIAGDPQVRKVFELAKATGLGAGDALQQAVRTGAATMAAQEAADARFFEFRDRYLRHLDGPPLLWTEAKP
jgi:hypothetical protein